MKLNKLRLLLMQLLRQLLKLPPKVANVYLWYSKDSQAHFGEGEAGKSAMDTRAAYMFEVVNEMYVNQRIKLEWNIVGSDFWDAPISEDSLINSGFLYGIQTVASITKNMCLKQMNVTKRSIKEEWRMMRRSRLAYGFYDFWRTITLKLLLRCSWQ